MDLINTIIMNLVLPIVVITFLIFSLPFFLVYRFISFIKRAIYSENVAGKIILITGASSGIGEYLAYEYAKKGACLALVARRENRLQEVAKRAKEFGCQDVVVICGDVSKIEDCKRFVHETINHFGRLDHLVNNAGIAQICKFEDYSQISDAAKIMDTNVWGSVYATHFAVPYLKKSRGKIIVIASVASWQPNSHLSFYNASKAALVSLYETLRIEFGSDIGITIVKPGLTESEIDRDGIAQKVFSLLKYESTQSVAKAILNSACRGDETLTKPFWNQVLLIVKVFCPEIIYWICRIILRKTDTYLSKKEV